MSAVAPRVIGLALAGVGFLLGLFGTRALLPDQQAELGTSTDRLPASARNEIVVGEAVAPDQALAPAERAGGVQPEDLHVAEDESTEAQVQTLAGPSRGFVRGVVRAADGGELQYGYVQVHLADGTRTGARSDDHGRYALGPLELGSYRLEASALNLRTAERDVAITSDSSDVRADFALEREQIVQVRVVTPDGETFSEAFSARDESLIEWNAVAVATRHDPGDTFDGVRGSRNNTFGIGHFARPGYLGCPNLGPEWFGCVFLHEPPPAWLSFVAAGQVLAKQAIDASTTQVTFVVVVDDVLGSTVEVRGRVVDRDTGRPVAARVQLSEDGLPFRPWSDADEAGGFVIDDAKPGRGVLVVSAAGHGTHRLELGLERGERRDLGTIELGPARELAGRVDAFAGAVQGIRIRIGLYDDMLARARWPGNRFWGVDEHNAFRAQDLEQGVYLVQALADDSSASIPVRADLSEGSVDGLELDFQDLVQVTVSAPDAVEPWPWITLREPGGLPVARWELGRYGPSRDLRLPRRAYAVEIERGQEVLERGSVRVENEPSRYHTSVR